MNPGICGRNENEPGKGVWAGLGPKPQIEPNWKNFGGDWKLNGLEPPNGTLALAPKKFWLCQPLELPLKLCAPIGGPLK